MDFTNKINIIFKQDPNTYIWTTGQSSRVFIENENEVNIGECTYICIRKRKYNIESWSKITSNISVILDWSWW